MTSPEVGAPLVDWIAAAQIAARLAPPGPRASRSELTALVAGLREAAAAATPHVLRVTRMTPHDARLTSGGATADATTTADTATTADAVTAGSGVAALSQVYVVDRSRWARANTEVMASLTDGVALAGGDAPDRTVSATTELAGAAQVGAVLAALSSRVLGQFDPYAVAAPGRLLLVAPNVLHLERELDLRPADFRLWVCLHEQTHALQFAAAPWLADHLRASARGLLGGLADSSRQLAESRLRDKLTTAGRVVLRAVRGQEGVAHGLLTPEQQRSLEEVSAVMALLEGHADVMMDAVGRATVPTVRTIRARFEARRDGQGSGTLDTVLRRFLGMDAKLAQYRDGAAFVRGVEKDVGRDGLNAVWAAPEHLPTAREIADPGAWVRRVHG
ncbi:zinc-dependent metalloprotease [Oerskovia turbata]